MPTQKQKKVAEAIVENIHSPNPLNGGDIVEKSGYGKSMRLFPGRILESKGVKEHLKQLGFSLEAADQVIWRLLHTGKKEETKIKAAQEIYKRMGGYAESNEQAKTIIINIDKALITKNKLDTDNE